MGVVGCITLDLVVIVVAAGSIVLLYVYGGSSFGFGPVMRWLFMLGLLGVAVWAGYSLRYSSCPSDWFGLFVLGCGVVAAATSVVVSKLLQRQRERIARIATERGMDVDVSQIGRGPAVQIRAIAHGLLVRLAEKVKNTARQQYESPAEAVYPIEPVPGFTPPPTAPTSIIEYDDGSTG